MSKAIKPLLASEVQFDKIKYPVLATPKLDGIRCLMVDGEAKSRSMKDIPNRYVQNELKGLNGLDGELMIDGNYNEVQSAMMSRDGQPDFTYFVFDRYDMANTSYKDRVEELEWLDHERIEVLLPVVVHDEDELNELMQLHQDQGYEGTMIRDPQAYYKFGRSTVSQGVLTKIKRFIDDEAILLRVVESMTNSNEPKLDNLGYTKRSSCKDHLLPSGKAGSFLINWQGQTFSIGFGPGFTDDDKKDLWDSRKELEGCLVKFKYQNLSEKGIPRFGKLLGLRYLDDM